MIDLLKNIFYIFGIFFGVFFLGKKYGADKEKGDQDKKILKNIKKANDIDKKIRTFSKRDFVRLVRKWTRR